jgi:hypothetical protein
MARSTSNEDFFYARATITDAKQDDQIILKVNISQYNPLEWWDDNDPEYDPYEDFNSDEEVESYLQKHYPSVVQIELCITHLFHHKYGGAIPGHHKLYFMHNKDSGETDPIGPHKQFDPEDFNTNDIAIEDIMSQDEIKERHEWNRRGNESATELAQLAHFAMDEISLIEMMAYPVFLDEDCQHLRFVFQTKLEDGSYIFNCKNLYYEPNEFSLDEIKKEMIEISEKIDTLTKRLN